MGKDVTICKLSLILVLLLTVSYLVDGFRLIQEKGKPEKIKKIDATQNDNLKQNYENQTVFFKPSASKTQKVKDSVEYDPDELQSATEESDEDVLKANIEITNKKITNVNITKNVLEKPDETVKIKSKLQADPVKPAKLNITKMLDEKKPEKPKKEDTKEIVSSDKDEEEATKKQKKIIPKIDESIKIISDTKIKPKQNETDHLLIKESYKHKVVKRIEPKTNATKKVEKPKINEPKTPDFTPIDDAKKTEPSVVKPKPKETIVDSKTKERKIETKKVEPDSVKSKIKEAIEVSKKEIVESKTKEKKIEKSEAEVSKPKNADKVDKPTPDIVKPSEKKLEIIKEAKKNIEESKKTEKVPKEDNKIKAKSAETKKVDKPTEVKNIPKTKDIPAPVAEKAVKKSSKENISPETAPLLVPNLEILENEECKNQGEIVLDQLDKRKLWALKMFDATAKMPSGILKGNLNQLGDYDQCLGIFAKIPVDEGKTEVKISGKYCLAAIDIDATTPVMKLPVNLAQSRAFVRSKNRDPGHFIPRFTTIQWGICIPSACSAKDVQDILEDYVKINNGSFNGVKFDILVEPNKCYVRKPPKKLVEIEFATIATIGLMTTLVVTAVVATFRDLIYQEENEDEENKSNMERIFMSFSLKQTISTFLRDSESDEIKCIHGIRAICTILLYIGHKIMPVGHSPFTNKVLLTEMSNSPFSIILRMSVIYTDSFLLLSGVLTAYHMSKDMEKKGHIPWVNRIFARIIRLTPSLIIVLLYYAYVMEITGEGPLWNTVVEQNAKLCQENWWKNLFYIQNIYPFEEMCATHTHQLALDMQLFLLSPILVWFLYKKPFMGVFTTLLLHALSLILRYYTTVNYRLSLAIYHGISISQLYRTANLLYASTLHRATPYLAGVGLGVLLRQMNPEFRMPKVLAVTGWLMTGYFVSWTFYTPSHLTSRNYQYDVDEAGQYAALCSLAWALALSWIIFASSANNEGYLNTVLSSRPMILLSKLSYTIYLTQFIVFFYNVGTIRTASEFHINKIINIPELLTVVIVSIILFLLVDLPMQKIKNVLTKPEITQKLEVTSECEPEVNTECETISPKLLPDSDKSDNENN